MTKKTPLIEEININEIDINKVDTTEFELPSQKNVSNEIDTLLTGYTQKEVPLIDSSQPLKTARKVRAKKVKKLVISGEIITGLLFITLLDLVLPMAMTSVNNALTGEKMSQTDLKLTQTQKNELEPIADEVMKELQLKADPIFILIVSFISIYGMKFMDAKMIKK